MVPDPWSIRGCESVLGMQLCRLIPVQLWTSFMHAIGTTCIHICRIVGTIIHYLPNSATFLYGADLIPNNWIVNSNLHTTTYTVCAHCSFKTSHSCTTLSIKEHRRSALTLYLSGSGIRSAKMFLARSWLAASPMTYSVMGREECWNSELTVTANFDCRSRWYSALVNVITTCIVRSFRPADVPSLSPALLDTVSSSEHSSLGQTYWEFAPKTVEWLCSDANTNNAHVKHAINVT